MPSRFLNFSIAEGLVSCKPVSYKKCVIELDIKISMIRPAPLPFARGKWKIEYFRKTKNPESEHGNLPNERLDREKLFKHAFGVEGKNLRKYGSKLRTSESLGRNSLVLINREVCVFFFR